MVRPEASPLMAKVPFGLLAIDRVGAPRAFGTNVARRPLAPRTESGPSNLIWLALKLLELVALKAKRRI